MRVLVTGAAGLTGGAVARRLAGRGHEVVALVRSASRPDGASRMVVGDVRDAEALTRALAGCDALAHCAGLVYGRDVARAPLGSLRRVVVIGTAAITTRAQRSRATYEANEDALREAAPGVAILRPTMIYGSARDRNIHHVIAFARRFRFLPVVGTGDGLIQPIHYEDVAAAAAALVDVEAGGAFEAGGAAPLTIAEALAEILHALGLRPRLIRVPVGPALAAARLADAVRDGRIAERILRMLEDRVADNDRLIEVTGVRPRAFAEGVRAQVAAP